MRAHRRGLLGLPLSLLADDRRLKSRNDQRRRQKRQFHRLNLEHLEDRTLLSGTSLDSTITGLVEAEGTNTSVQNGIQSVDTNLFNNVLGHTLPLVGTAFKTLGGTSNDLFLPIGAALSTKLGALTGSITDADVSGAISAALGSKLASPVTDTPTGSPATSVEFFLDIKDNLINSSFSPSFNLGLPGLTLSLQGNVKITLSYELKLGLGIDDSGFFIDTTPATTNFTLTLDFTTPGASVDGSLFFLKLHSTDGTAKGNTEFKGTFAVTLTDDDNHLSLPSEAASLANLNAKLSADAGIHFKNNLSFGGSAQFPSLNADFDMSWHFGNATVDAGNSVTSFGDEPDIAFNNVSLDVGSFFDKFVSPVVKTVKSILDPLQPIIDVLQTRIPVLSDIGPLRSLLDHDHDGKVTLLDVIDTLDSGAETKFLDTVVALDNLVTSIPSGVTTTIPLGSFDLTNNSVDARSADLSKVTLTILSDAPDIISELNAIPGVSGFVSQIQNSVFGGAGGDDGGGIKFPLIENPKLAFGLLLGQNVPLFTFDLPTLKASFKFDQFFSILGPLGVELRGTVHPDNTALELNAHIAFGYDTAGIVEFANDHFDPSKIADLLDGFFVSTTDKADGSGSNFVSQATINMGMGAFAALDLVVFDAGVGGGINANINFKLHDADMDGKLRPKEIADDFSEGPLCIFETTGAFTASLSAFVKIGFDTPFGFVGYEDDFTIATATLLNFNFGCNMPGTPAPVLATPGGGSPHKLELNIGLHAADRMNGDLKNHDEVFVVDHAGGSKGDESIFVTAFNFKQKFDHVSEIDADAGPGDTITIDPGVLDDSVLNGGIGKNQLMYLGSGNATLTAQGSDNQLTGGAGMNTLDARMATGHDLLIGGPGTNVFYAALHVPMGGVGDTMVAGPNNDTMNGGNGADHFIAGAGADVMNGGTGNDIFSWTVGDGPPTITANASSINSLDVSGIATNDTFQVDPYMVTGVMVNADGVVVKATGITILNIDGDAGTNMATFDDLSGTSLKTIGVNTKKLNPHVNPSVNTTTINGPSSDTTMKIDEFTGTVTTGIDAMGMAQTANGTAMEITGLGPRFLIADVGAPSPANNADSVIVNLGNGHDTSTIATSTLLGTLVVNGGTGINEFDVQSVSGPTTINAKGGQNTFNVGTIAPNTGGLLSGIKGPLTLNGSMGSDTANVDDTGDMSAQTGTLTPTTLTGLGMGPSGITYSGLTLLNINLGSGGNTFFINDINPPTETHVDGGLGSPNSVTATFALDFNGKLFLTHFQKSTISVTRDFNGFLSDLNPGTVQLVTIGRSLTATGQLIAGSIDTMTVGTGPAQPVPWGDLAGLIDAVTNIGTLTVGHSVTYQGVIQAGDPNLTIGNLNTMTVGPNMLMTGDDMAGQIQVTGTLTQLTVAGGTPGNITAGMVGTIGTYGGYGPYVLQVNESGIQRRVEAAVPASPYPIFRNFMPPQPTPPVSPMGVTIQYFYEGLVSFPSGPCLTARVTNASPTVDEFDLSLTTWSDTAKFNLCRLDAVGTAGIRNVAVEGDVLTSVSTAANNFTPPPDGDRPGVYLPLDVLAGVGVRGNVTAGAVTAKSIQGVAFGSLTDATGTFLGPNANQVEAQEMLAAGTAIVQAKDTFRVPFADNVPVAFFLDTTPGGVLDNKPVLFTDQGAIASLVTGIADVRGAVTALVTANVPGPSTPSDIATIAMTGDGGAIQTAQDGIQTITSTGPLGDVTMSGPHGLVANVTAPSIIGNLMGGGGINNGLIQTTGQRTDPISGTQGAILADFGRTLTDANGHIIGVTTVQSTGAGIGSELVSRHNFISSIIANGGISAVVAGQGDFGVGVVDPVTGNLTRFGGVQSNGHVTGDFVFLGNIFADFNILHGGLKGGRIAAQGQPVAGLAASRTGILGNLTFSGDVDGGSAIVSGGEIGDATSGTGITVSNIRGILAAIQGINILSGNLKGAAIFRNAVPPNSTAINAIFAPGSFDVTFPDLQGLAMILTHLNNLHVGADGNLTIVPFVGKTNGLSKEITGTAGSGTIDLQTVGWSSSVGAPIVLGVYVANPDGTLTADEHARIDAAIATLDQTWIGGVGLDLVEVSDPTLAAIIVSNAASSAAGGQADGVLGSATLTFAAAASGALDEGVPYLQFTGQAVVNLIEGWNWYTGSDPTQMGAGQYDYQSVVTHELGHSVGLYHDVTSYGSLNSDGYSAMYPVLNPQQNHRQLSPYDISWLNHLYANGENPGGNDGPEAVAALMAGHLSGSQTVLPNMNERNAAPTLVQPANGGIDFQSAVLTDADLPPVAYALGSPVTIPALSRESLTFWAANNEAPDAILPATVHIQPLNLVQTPVSFEQFYTGLSTPREMVFSSADSRSDQGEASPIFSPDSTKPVNAENPAGTTAAFEARPSSTPTIWDRGVDQLPTAGQWASSLGDLLVAPSERIEAALGISLGSAAWLFTMLGTCLTPREKEPEKRRISSLKGAL